MLPLEDARIIVGSGEFMRPVSHKEENQGHQHADECGGVVPRIVAVAEEKASIAQGIEQEC